MNIRGALAAGTVRLADSSDTPRLDAEVLMAHALGIEREMLLLSDLELRAPAAFEPLLARRIAGEPVAYITGRRAFWTVELEVGPGALVPRPDSETLIAAAAKRFGIAGPKTVLDLGTGPGTLLLAALDQWPRAYGLGIDASAEALGYARRNAERLGMADRATFREGDWAKGVQGRFDLLLCNPPYVEAGADLPRDVAEWEPASALYAGADGLDDYRRLAPVVGGLLAESGIGCIEIGAGQRDAAGELFEQTGLNVAVRNDLGGHPRCLILTN